MDPLTPEQKRQLDSWAAQRDTILGEISVLNTEKENLNRSNNDAAQSYTEIEAKINRCLGRLEELEKKEEEFKTKVSKSVADLMVEESRLQTSVFGKKIEVQNLDDAKDALIKTITILTSVHANVFEKTTVLDQIVEHVTKICGDNVKEVEVFMADLKKSVQGIIDLNSDNVKNTKFVLDKLPRYIFELQKPIPIRRPIVGPVTHDPVPQTLEIKPEKKK